MRNIRIERLLAYVGVAWLACCAALSASSADVLREGRMALSDGFYRLAKELLYQVLSDSESETAAQASAADYILHTHYEQRDFAALSENLERFMASGVLAGGAAVCWQALLHEAKGDRESMRTALSWFETPEGQKSGYAPRGLRLKALAHFEDGNAARAVEIFEQLDHRYAETPARYYNRMDWGLVLFSEDSVDEAQAVWQPLTLETNVPSLLVKDTRYWMAQAHLQTGAVAEAEALLQHLVDDQDLDERRRMLAVFALADCRQMAGEPSAGTILLSEWVASVRNPDLRRQAELRQAIYLLETGALDEASDKIRLFAGSYVDDPESVMLLRRLGFDLLVAGRAASADEVFQQALEAFGDSNGELYRGRAMALSEQGRDSEAALLYEQAAAAAPEGAAADSLFRAGDRYFAAGQYRRALDAYNHFLSVIDIAVDPVLVPRALFQRGASLAALEETYDAVAVFEALAADFPKTTEAANALLSIGDLYLKPGYYEDAAAAFERVMQAYPEGEIYWRALHGRGMARYHLWIPEALNDFEKLAASVDSELSEHSFFMQAMSLYRLGRDALALEVCRAFLTKFPDSEWAPPVHFWIARFEYNIGNYEDAGREFLAFVERYPQHELAPQALLRTGLSAIRRQQFLVAIELFGRMAKQYPQSKLLAEARFNQAEAMVQLGRFAVAILVYEEVINSADQRELAAMAWGRKGDCQFTLGADDPARYEEAVLSYLSVFNTPGLRLNHTLQAAYKLGLTYEKLGRSEQALEFYYGKVMLPFLIEREQGGIPGESASTWFSRAARAAANLVEARKDWRRLVRILERAAAADVEFSAEARARMRAVKSDYWWMFY